MIIHQLIFLHHLHLRIHHNDHPISLINALLYTLITINEFATCVVQRLQCNQTTPDTTKQHQIFYSRYSVKIKVCNLIIDNRSCENFISRALVNYLKLEIKSYLHPYTISWIRKSLSIKITNLCHVSFSIGKFY